MSAPAEDLVRPTTPRAAPPIAMLAELTHRCPLACPYCSNPLELKAASDELSTEDWISVFRQAADLGVLQMNLSGGEPASRRDLVDLVAASAGSGLYTNLITSGIGFTEKRFADTVAAGVDHVQLSLQGVDAESADLVGGYKGGHARKIAFAGWVSQHGVPLTVNAVVHRGNLDSVERTVELAVELGARRLEVATVQFHGWAVRNRRQLLPTPEQVKATTEAVHAARERFKGVLVIDYVPADYYAQYPKPCMEGWGRSRFNVDPTGLVLPCHAAESITGMTFDNVRERPLKDIWYSGEAFNAYRGTDWMQEPCASCDRKTKDFGGCRCQALALAGDAAATDPVCIKSPLRQDIKIVARDESQRGGETAFTYRGRA